MVYNVQHQPGGVGGGLTGMVYTNFYVVSVPDKTLYHFITHYKGSERELRSVTSIHIKYTYSCSMIVSYYCKLYVILVIKP